MTGSPSASFSVGSCPLNLKPCGVYGPYLQIHTNPNMSFAHNLLSPWASWLIHRPPQNQYTHPSGTSSGGKFSQSGFQRQASRDDHPPTFHHQQRGLAVSHESQCLQSRSSLATADTGIKHFLSAGSIPEACLPTLCPRPSLPPSSSLCFLLQFQGPQSLGAPPY